MLMKPEASAGCLGTRLPNTRHSNLCSQYLCPYLKSVYTREKLQVYDKWPQVKFKKYINLALIEKKNITTPEADQFTRAIIHRNIDDINQSK